jgi:hypothetical protein
MSAVNIPVKPLGPRPHSASFSAPVTPRDVPSSRRSVASLPSNGRLSQFAHSVGKSVVTPTPSTPIQVHSRRSRSVEPHPQLKLWTRAPLPYPDWKAAAEASMKSPRSPRSPYGGVPSKVGSFIRQPHSRDPAAYSRQQRSVERLIRSRSLEPVSVDKVGLCIVLVCMFLCCVMLCVCSVCHRDHRRRKHSFPYCDPPTLSRCLHPLSLQSPRPAARNSWCKWSDSGMRQRVPSNQPPKVQSPPQR